MSDEVMRNADDELALLGKPVMATMNGKVWVRGTLTEIIDFCVPYKVRVDDSHDTRYFFEIRRLTPEQAMTPETPAKVTATTLPDEPKHAEKCAIYMAGGLCGCGYYQRLIEHGPTFRKAAYALLQSFNAERLRAEAMAKDAGRYRRVRSTHDDVVNKLLADPNSKEDEIDKAVDAMSDRFGDGVARAMNATAIEQGAQHG